jgi:hypothetical protein
MIEAAISLVAPSIAQQPAAARSRVAERDVSDYVSKPRIDLGFDSLKK